MLPLEVTSSELPRIYYASIGTSDTHFKVDAFPRSVSFRWFFNSSELEEWISPASYQQAGLASSLQFVPKSSKVAVLF